MSQSCALAHGFNFRHTGTTTTGPFLLWKKQDDGNASAAAAAASSPESLLSVAEAAVGRTPDRDAWYRRDDRWAVRAMCRYRDTTLSCRFRHDHSRLRDMDDRECGRCCPSNFSYYAASVGAWANCGIRPDHLWRAGAASAALAPAFSTRKRRSALDLRHLAGSADPPRSGAPAQRAAVPVSTAPRAIARNLHPGRVVHPAWRGHLFR
jgi:hypothetical protein